MRSRIEHICFQGWEMYVQHRTRHHKVRCTEFMWYIFFSCMFFFSLGWEFCSQHRTQNSKENHGWIWANLFARFPRVSPLSQHMRRRSSHRQRETKTEKMERKSRKGTRSVSFWTARFWTAVHLSSASTILLDCALCMVIKQHLQRRRRRQRRSGLLQCLVYFESESERVRELCLRRRGGGGIGSNVFMCAFLFSCS